MTYKLSVDINLMDGSLNVPGMETLKRWKEEGKVELFEVDPPKNQREPAYGWPGAPPRKEPEDPRKRGRGRAGKMEESGKANFKSIAGVLFPGKDPLRLNMTEINDVAHLIRHHLMKNEVFITGNTRDFIEGGRRERLKASFGIIAMTPEEAVRMLGEIQGWEPEPPPSRRSKSRA